MAGELRIKSGTKLRMALDVPIGQEPEFNLVCTFIKSLDAATFLISIPMQGGQPLALNDQEKLLICYGPPDGLHDRGRLRRRCGFHRRRP